MKIAPMPSAVNAITMPVSQTPGQLPTEVADQKLPIPDTNETKTEVEAVQPLSPQFAELAKRRRALQLKERALLEQEKALAAKGTGSSGIDPARLKSETLRVLEEAGVTYDDLTQQLMSSQSNTELKALEAKLSALEKGIEQKFTEKEQQARQQVLSEMKREAQLLASQGDEFSLVREMGKISDVMRLIEQTYDTTGEVLDVGEAMKLVEEELFKDFNKLTGLEKLRSQFNPPAPTQPQPQTGMRTLRNKDTANAPLSAKQRAMAAFHGTLKH